MLTVDVQVAGVRERDVRNRFSVPPRITARTLAQGIAHPRWSAGFLARPRMTPANLGWSGSTTKTLASAVNRAFDPTVTWDDLADLRERWAGPLLVKGIMRADDAQRCVELGVDALVVSNHGGRQLDGAAATIDALPAIADAVGDRAELILDSGVRRGTDIVKALALGARAVMIGRPLVYGLGRRRRGGRPPRVRDPRGGAEDRAGAGRLPARRRARARRRQLKSPSSGCHRGTPRGGSACCRSAGSSAMGGGAEWWGNGGVSAPEDAGWGASWVIMPLHLERRSGGSARAFETTPRPGGCPFGHRCPPHRTVSRAVRNDERSDPAAW